MERRVSLLDDQGYEDEPVEHVKIAVTTLAFNNAEMIDLLKQRGTAIKAEKWDQQRKIEEEINQLKSDKFEELITPVSIFMTFECEEGVNRALSMDEQIKDNDNLKDLKLDIWFENHTIKLENASEPSDIIWEHR